MDIAALIRAIDAPAEERCEGATRCAIVTLEASALGVASEALAAALTERQIGVSVAPSTHTFDNQLWSEPSTVRMSPTYFNTDAEVDSVVEAVRALMSELQ